MVSTWKVLHPTDHFESEEKEKYIIKTKGINEYLPNNLEGEQDFLVGFLKLPTLILKQTITWLHILYVKNSCLASIANSRTCFS